jgi:hypothetical protein
MMAGPCVGMEGLWPRSCGPTWQRRRGAVARLYPVWRQSDAPPICSARARQQGHGNRLDGERLQDCGRKARSAIPGARYPGRKGCQICQICHKLPNSFPLGRIEADCRESGCLPDFTRENRLFRGIKDSGLGGTRTHDQCLKRALLYRLSYQPITFKFNRLHPTVNRKKCRLVTRCFHSICDRPESSGDYYAVLEAGGKRFSQSGFRRA